jgi:hypothetical protein
MLVTGDNKNGEDSIETRLKQSKGGLPPVNAIGGVPMVMMTYQSKAASSLS